MEKSQRVTIEYDKGYGYFIVKRSQMEYGVENIKRPPKKEFQKWLSLQNNYSICVIALNVISIIIAIRKDVIHGANGMGTGSFALIIDYIP